MAALPESNNIYEPSFINGALRQGEILTNAMQIILDLDTISAREPSIERMIHPYVIIVSQDCDLDWDYNHRKNPDTNKLQNKNLPNILFCMLAEATELRFRDDDNPKDVPKEINRRVWNEIRKNKHERYHFLEKIRGDRDVIEEGLPELAADFKRYFTLPAAEVYKRINDGEMVRRCRLISPYLEHFCTRFHYFQYRVALPGDHYSE